ncbi:MAG: XapX domain-containing protein [Akkermansiaceae bacterium]
MPIEITSLGTGIIVGLIFAAFKLPLPAPPVLAGILGIVGIFLGGELWKQIMKFFES